MAGTYCGHLRPEQIPAELKVRLGLRDSLRLLAASDIVAVFSYFSEFSRSEVIREFGDVYGAKCLDRAIADLEAGGAIDVVQKVKRDVSAGASYRVTHHEDWSPRKDELMAARMQRHGRGGCRK